MAACTSVQVLCPNGRRQTIKVTPSTTLLQALEEVCKKQNFLPPEEYDFFHSRKILDLTLTFRYANLSNNAKLELVKAKTPRALSNVLIALQLESGERLQHEFTPNSSLWDILQHWDSQRGSAVPLCSVDTSRHPPQHPVCVYLGEETVGEFAMRETTLKKLGLTGGRAIIRLVHRPVDDLTIARSIEAVEKDRLKQARLDEKVKQQSELSVLSTATISHPVTQSGGSSGVSQMSEDMDTDDSSMYIPMESTPSSVTPDAARPSSYNNAIERRGGNSSNRETPLSSSGANSALSAMETIPGVQIFRPSDFYDLSPQEQEIARRLAQRLMPQLGLGQPSQTSAQRSTPRSTPAQSFTDFKFPETTKGKTLYQNELSEVSKKEFKPCDRETVLFRSDEPRPPKQPGQDDLPDDFFDVTVSDVQSMLADYQQRLQSSSDQPLLTQAMRENVVQQKMNKYRRAVIRIQFPDRLVLQALFRPRETVFAVQKFVKEHLEDKSIPFHLYTTPPKTVLKDVTKTVLEADLVPATVVYFSSEVKKDHYLSQAVLKEVSTMTAAELVVHRTMQSRPMDTDEEGPSTSQAVSQNVANSASTSQGEKKVPKWFKKGKK